MEGAGRLQKPFHASEYHPFHGLANAGSHRHGSVIADVSLGIPWLGNGNYGGISFSLHHSPRDIMASCRDLPTVAVLLYRLKPLSPDLAKIKVGSRGVFFHAAFYNGSLERAVQELFKAGVYEVISCRNFSEFIPVHDIYHLYRAVLQLTTWRELDCYREVATTQVVGEAFPFAMMLERVRS